MISFAVAFALLLHVIFWGIGLAVLVMPGRWAKFWPVLVLPAGFAQQALVVWVGIYAGWPGTNHCAYATEMLPLLLLVVAGWRRGWRRTWNDIGRFGLVWATIVGTMVVLVLPLAIASRGLTSISLGSCDAADYAAGARVFMEFAHSDRTGFLGLSDVVRVMSVDNFYDFWLRLNHFTPSALIALNGSVLHCAPHELTSILTIVVLVGMLPIVFWIARALFGYSGAASLGVAAAYGLGPIPWYSVAQVSPAPILASGAIALLTWSGVALWNGLLTWRRGLGFLGVLMLAYALVLGSYNFIGIVCLVPAIAYAGGWTLYYGTWRRFGRWLVLLLLPLIPAGFVFWARVAGLIERFVLFRTYDFGWPIPVLTPEGWLGMVEGGSLAPWRFLGLRWLLAAIVLFALGWALTRASRKRRHRLWLFTSVTVPVLLGYAMLEVRGARLGTNASYDAFKLFTVFYPLLLAAFFWWLTLRWSDRLFDWVAVAAMIVIVAGFNLLGCVMYVVKLSRPPLIVDGELRQIRRIEAMPDVASVNVLLPDMWSRLWANEFLLRKPQYFATHSYEGRLNTALRGDWDLDGDEIRVEPAGAVRPVTPHYVLVDTRGPHFVRARPGPGWYAEERLGGDRWRWTKGDAAIAIDNPHDRPITLGVRLDGHAFDRREIALVVDGVPSGYTTISAERGPVLLPDIRVPPGRSTVVLHSREPAVTPPGDNRSLSLCVFSLTLVPR